MTPRQAASRQLQGLEKSVPDRPRAKPWNLRGILQAESTFDEQKSDAKA